MKKIKILLACAIALTSFATIGTECTFADNLKNDNVIVSSSETELVKESISLRGNPSTGYGWEYFVFDDSIAQIEKSSYDSDPTPEGPYGGVGGTYTWPVKGLKEALKLFLNI